MKPQYSIDRWTHGWTISGPNGAIPITAISDNSSMFGKGMVMIPRIAHHLKTSGQPDVVVAIATIKDAAIWEDEIEESLKDKPPEERWWKGLHVGKSSATIFALFCENQWKGAAEKLGGGATPQDSDDLGRCIHLMEVFPEWEPQLAKVIDAHPNTGWKKIIENWEFLKKASPPQRHDFLKNT